MKKICCVYLISALLLSCGVKKEMVEARSTLDEIQTQKEKEKLQIKAISDTANAKFSIGKIDQNIDSLVKGKLNRYNQSLDSIQNKIALIDTLLSNKKSFHKNYKSYIIPLLDTLRQLNVAYMERAKLYAMIESALNIADFQRFDLAAFFGPGKYIIPEDKKDIARQSFSPIVDSMRKFANQYENVPKTATLVILGFADGTGFSAEGELLDTLTAEINKKDANKEDLNFALSQLRAKELVKQLKMIFINETNLSVNYIPQGKGEEAPLSYIKNYTIDDPRRRIVLCYWTVLPD
jgi:outer membrane protein OmpA-like peptidoglycan-associated protein